LNVVTVVVVVVTLPLRCCCCSLVHRLLLFCYTVGYVALVRCYLTVVTVLFTVTYAVGYVYLFTFIIWFVVTRLPLLLRFTVYHVYVALLVVRCWLTFVRTLPFTGTVRLLPLRCFFDCCCSLPLLLFVVIVTLRCWVNICRWLTFVVGRLLLRCVLLRLLTCCYRCCYVTLRTLLPPVTFDLPFVTLWVVVVVPLLHTFVVFCGCWLRCDFVVPVVLVGPFCCCYVVFTLVVVPLIVVVVVTLLRLFTICCCVYGYHCGLPFTFCVALPLPVVALLLPVVTPVVVVIRYIYVDLVTFTVYVVPVVYTAVVVTLLRCYRCCWLLRSLFWLLPRSFPVRLLLMPRLRCGYVVHTYGCCCYVLRSDLVIFVPRCYLLIRT